MALYSHINFILPCYLTSTYSRIEFICSILFCQHFVHFKGLNVNQKLSTSEPQLHPPWISVSLKANEALHTIIKFIGIWPWADASDWQSADCNGTEYQKNSTPIRLVLHSGLLLFLILPFMLIICLLLNNSSTNLNYLALKGSIYRLWSEGIISDPYLNKNSRDLNFEDFVDLTGNYTHIQHVMWKLFLCLCVFLLILCYHIVVPFLDFLVKTYLRMNELNFCSFFCWIDLIIISLWPYL